MLQSMQSKIGKSLRLGVRVNRHHPALFSKFIERNHRSTSDRRLACPAQLNSAGLTLFSIELIVNPNPLPLPLAHSSELVPATSHTPRSIQQLGRIQLVAHRS